MVEFCYSAGSDRVFHFSGLYDVLPAQYQPLTEEGNEAAFFLDLFRRHGILLSGKAKRQPDGDLEYPCSFGGIGFTMIDDVYNNFVHFEVDTPSQRKTLAQRLRALILEACR
jgi:hypothetical protein